MISLCHPRQELHLRHTFRLARGASDERHNLILELERQGLTGLGEATPIERYGQDWQSAARATEEMVARLEHPRSFYDTTNRVAVPGQPAAEAAVDMALRHLVGKRLVNDDPCIGATVEDGRLVLPSEPGIGVRPCEPGIN